MTLTQRIETCHRCARKAGTGAGCAVDGVSLSLHADAGYCPLKLYGEGQRPTGFPETPAEEMATIRARAEENRRQDEQRRVEAGRALWAELHAFCLTDDARDPAKLAAFLEAFGKRVPCGDCRRHWNEILARLPPDAGRPFEWSVAAHNEVNVKLDKPTLTVGEARQRWGAS